MTSAIKSDHPRSCGANCTPSRSHFALTGSSPLVRGQLNCATPIEILLRIIPARAGPTGSRLTCWGAACGSSPLVRGQRNRGPDVRGHGRIIPARAGPTGSVFNRFMLPPDHPRSCGANVDARRLLTGWNGSSPLVRGQRDQRDSEKRLERIIPARAGPTKSMSPHSSP